MQIQTPDIGVDKATVADILVKVGDTIAVDDRCRGSEKYFGTTGR